MNTTLLSASNEVERSYMTDFVVIVLVGHFLKPLSVTTSVVGLQTDDADHAGQNSSAAPTWPASSVCKLTLLS